MSKVEDLLVEEEKRACSPPLGYSTDNPKGAQANVKLSIGHLLHPKINPRVEKREREKRNAKER